MTVKVVENIKKDDGETQSKLLKLAFGPLLKKILVGSSDLTSL